MPVKSVVSVDVDSSSFDSFQQKFKQYQEALSKSPGAWAAVGKENKSLAAGFKTMTAALLAQTEMAHKEAAELKKVEQSTERASSYWKSMVRSSKSVLDNVGKIKDGIESVFKFAGFGFIFSGLGALGSLFGFDRLAAYASGLRRSSTGLGVSAGQQNAFNVTFGRYVDTGTLLHGASTALGDVTSPEAIALGRMGVRPTGNAADTSLEILKRARDLANRYQGKEKEKILATMGNSLGFNQFGIGIEEFRRLRGMSDDDLKQYNERTRTLAMSPKAMKGMQDFDIALSELSVKLKTSLGEALSDLSNPLKKLTEGLGEAVRKILGSQGFKDAIAWVSDKLNQFADWMNSPTFKKDITDFAERVGIIAKEIWSGIKVIGRILMWIGEKFPQFAPFKVTSADRPDIAFSRWILKQFGKGGTAQGAANDNNAVGTGAPGGTVSGGAPSSSVTVMASGPAGEEAALKQIGKLEGGTDGKANSIGAVGKYQIMPNTAKQYGYNPADLYDAQKNEQVARTIVHDLMTRYHGNLAQVLIGYNAGPGVADFYGQHGYLPRTWHGKSWNPEETQKYLERAGIKVDIRMENNTGGNTIASASAMGAAGR